MKSYEEQYLEIIHQAIHDKKYQEAYHALLAYKEVLDKQPNPDQENYIMAYTLINRMLRFTYEKDITRYHLDDLKLLLETYQTEDTLFIINGYRELLECMKVTKDFQAHYDIYTHLINLYRIMNDQKNVEYYYQALLNLIESLKHNVIAYAQKADQCVLETTQLKHVLNLTYDIIEETSVYKSIKNDLEKMITDRIGLPGKMGYCYQYWSLKKELLNNMYHMSWDSPGVLNDVIFD